MCSGGWLLTGVGFSRQWGFLFSGCALVAGLLLSPGCGRAVDPNSDQGVVQDQSVGAASYDFLASTQFKSLVVEIASVSGSEPSTEALQSLVSFLDRYVNKPSGIQVVMGATFDSPHVGRSYTSDELKQLELKYRRQYASGSRIAAFFLFLDGGYVNDQRETNTTGLAYTATSMAVFGRPIAALAQYLPQVFKSNIEAAVMVHEFGHLMGLVNMGLPMVQDHADSGGNHRTHCANPRCVMYYAINRPLDAMTYQVPDLDEACRADLRARGGR